MSCSLNSLKGLCRGLYNKGSMVGLLKGDARARIGSLVKGQYSL